MARIDTYTAQRGLNPGSTPTVQLNNPVAEEVGRLGGAVQDLSATLIQRAEQREDFKVDNDYRNFQLGLQADLENQSQTMEPGGFGFHDKFLTETFKPKRDEFLAKVPERLKPKFETLLSDESGSDTTEWSNKAALSERDESYRWQKEQITLTHDQIANAASLEPDRLNEYLTEGQKLIDSSTLPTPEKASMTQQWRKLAQVAVLNELLTTDPQGVYRKLGMDARKLSPQTQFDLLSKAVQWQESADNPNAKSSKGAVGLMQVMPATAREIAAEIGDENFPSGAVPDSVVGRYLSNPFINKTYGEHYLKKQLKAYAGSRDPIETALVAYNAGPSVADKWIESGYDDRVLPKETRDYKAEIMGQLAAPVVKGNPASVEFIYQGKPTSGDRFMVGNPSGLTAQGNIDLLNRPQVKNSDGSISTVRSMSFEEDGVEILVPTVSLDGKRLSDEQAIAQYQKTGQFLGKFSNAASATAYAQSLHEQQAALYTGQGESGSGVPNVNPDLQGRVRDAYATLGLTKVKVNSGFRDPDKNKAVGGADKSQHLDGNALDLDVTGMPIPQRIELLKALSASGITGIGIYANSIHADLGGRRAWGPSYGADSVPAWAKPVLEQHLNGTTPPPRAIDSDFADLPYDVRNQFTTKADQIISAQSAAEAKSTAVQKVDVRRQMENELASIRTTGQGTGMNPGDVATILGEDDYLAFERRFDVAQRTYTATNGIAQMAPGDMEARFTDYAPRPGAADFADQQEVQTAVQREIDRVTRLRASSPDQAALEYPEVKGAYQALTDQMAQGDPPPAAVQGFVKQMLDTQAGFDVAPNARAPIPHDWAVEIGAAMSRVPEPARGNIAEIRASIEAQYQELYKYFGDYTDDVIVYSLSEYKGISKDQGELLGGLVQQLVKGGGTFRKGALDAAQDQSQIDGFSRKNVFGETPLLDQWFPAKPADDGLSPEERLRRDAAAATEE